MELKNTNILVTGAGGFIGSHLVEELLKHPVKNVWSVVYYGKGNMGNLKYVATDPRMQIVTGDIKNSLSMKLMIDAFEIDYVFHLAALGSVPYSFENPSEFIKTNTLGTLNVCNAALNCKRILVTSTSEVYGSPIYCPIDEKHPLTPQSPYSASKIGADAIAQSLHYSNNLNLVIARPFNNYGPRQSLKAITPTIITQLLKHPKYVTLGNINTTRDYIYVKDTVRHMINVLLKGKVNEIYNIGSGVDIEIREWVETIAKLMDIKHIEVRQNDSAVRKASAEVERLQANTNKLLETISDGIFANGFISTNILETILWYTNNFKDLDTTFDYNI
jgi:dTDP-D-glucose 4,6-dehydratase